VTSASISVGVALVEVWRHRHPVRANRGTTVNPTLYINGKAKKSEIVG
jgi:hypothetical protein